MKPELAQRTSIVSLCAVVAAPANEAGAAKSVAPSTKVQSRPCHHHPSCL
jgi:hypothetical protein